MDLTSIGQPAAAAPASATAVQALTSVVARHFISSTTVSARVSVWRSIASCQRAARGFVEIVAGRSVRVGVTALAPKSSSCDEKVGGISAEPYRGVSLAKPLGCRTCSCQAGNQAVDNLLAPRAGVSFTNAVWNA